MSERDRNKILERRALFLGSALAALAGCARQTPATEPGEPQVLSIPPTTGEDPEAAPDATADTPPRAPAGQGDMPPLDIPNGISERARQNYQSLVDRMKGVHKVLDDMQGMVPTCTIKACEAKWKELAEKHFSLDDAFRFSYVCPGSSAEAKAYMERHDAHMKFYQERRTALENELTAKLGKSGWDRYQELRNEISAANPRPCLSFACQDW
jgi:hypothetical protein